MGLSFSPTLNQIPVFIHRNSDEHAAICINPRYMKVIFAIQIWIIFEVEMITAYI